MGQYKKKNLTFKTIFTFYLAVNTVVSRLHLQHFYVRMKFERFIYNIFEVMAFQI